MKPPCFAVQAAERNKLLLYWTHPPDPIDRSKIFPVSPAAARDEIPLQTATFLPWPAAVPVGSTLLFPIPPEPPCPAWGQRWPRA